MRILRIVYPLLLFFVLYTKSSGQDLTVEKAIDEALKNNLDIKKSNLNIEIAESNFYKEIFPENPNIFLEYDEIPESKGLSYWEEKRYGFKQKFALPFSYYFKGSIANDLIKIERTNYQKTRFLIRSVVKKTFTKLLYLNYKEENLNDLVEIYSSVAKKAALKTNLGETTKYDSIRAEINLLNLKSDLFELKKSKKSTLEKLKYLINNEIEFTSILGSLEFQHVSIDFRKLKEILLKNNFDISRLKDEYNIAENNQILSWMNLVPEFELSYFQKEIQTESLNKKFWGGEIAMSIPLYGIFNNRSDIKNSNITADKLKFEIERKKKELFTKLEELLNQLESQQVDCMTLRRTLSGSKELLRISQRSYEEGEMDFIKLADAIKTNFDSQIGYLDRVYQIELTKIEIEKLCGKSVFTKDGE